MDLELKSVQFVQDPALFKHFTQAEDGAVGQDLKRRGRRLAALAKASVGRDTGRLATSIGVQFIPGPIPSVKIGSDVRHAYVVHEGSRPHHMHALPGRMLRFVIRGRVVYAQDVRHPGTTPQKYLSRHLRKIVND